MGCVRDISVTHPGVIQASSFAWKHLAVENDLDITFGRNFKIHVAGIQIVNGVNYCLLQQGDFDNIQFQYTATVYKAVDQQFYLTRSRVTTALRSCC